MKNILFTIILSLFILSCDENISYLGQFEQQYALNCILRNDKEIQYATLKRSYPPNEQNLDTDITNAVIKLILPDTVLVFKDSLLATSISSSIKSYYYLKPFRLKKNTEIKIEATLPDGKVLTSETHSPAYYTMLFPEDGANPSVIPNTASGSTYYYRWEIYNNPEPVIFGPAFYISYFITGSEDIIHYKEVVGSYDLTYEYKVPAEFIDIAMQEISNGITNPATINILGACFEVKVYDNALGIYANSIKTFDDEFSVRISEPNISNIKGGLGIFGTYISEKFIVDIDIDYINSFGYTVAPE